jgi:hypothetical protein
MRFLDHPKAPAKPHFDARRCPLRISLAYNPGVVHRDGVFRMVFRSDHGWDPEKKKLRFFAQERPIA